MKNEFVITDLGQALKLMARVKGGPMLGELVICGASLPDGICSGAEPPEEWRDEVDSVFEGKGVTYRLLPAIERPGTAEEEDHRDDGTYREMPMTLELGQYKVKGAIICTSCYVTLCMLSPSGRGETHELARAIAKARSMQPEDLPRLAWSGE